MSLKKFEVLEMIAKGGMAEVYRAKTVGLQGFEKIVCVKKILPHLTEDQSFVNMFVNEAKLAATLNYANIVQVHDLAISAGSEYFIVMEYVHGKDLSDVIRAAQLAGREIPPDIAMFIGREVLKGLYYAHTKTDAEGAPLNIIHRDISPHNVLVSFMGEVKLTDFGIAKASSIMNKTAVGILKGKYGYMSPEQARGQPLDARSDLFNTGIVLYELLVGERCFAGSSDFSTLNLMRNAEVTPPTKINAHVPKELEAIVLKALSLKREDRFQDAMEFERALGAYARSSGQVATATEAADFMRALFSGAEENKGSYSTGVLQLESVQPPPPPPPSEPALEARKPDTSKSEVERRPEKSRVKDPLKDVPKEAPKEAPKEPEPKAEPATDREAEKAAKKAAALKLAAERKAAKEREKQAAEAPAEAPAEPKAEEKKPAKLKDDEGKKKGKQISTTPKKPVGRKDLRPGLTQLAQLRRYDRKSALFKAVLFLGVFAGAGVALGLYRAGAVARDSTFREAEGAREVVKDTVMLYLATDPPGATVSLDGHELADKTPLTVERDRDANVHTVVLTRDGHRTVTRELRYDNRRVTFFREKLLGDPGRLVLQTNPSGLDVTVDGEPMGKTPLDRELSSGTRQLRIRGADRELTHAIEIEAGRTATLKLEVPSQEGLATLRLSSLPRARIYLGGKPTPHWTNGEPLPLAPGVPHKIGLKVGKRLEEVVVSLERGEKRRLFLDLSES